jgi:anthranilate phosphoribosyltransferase
MSSQPANLIPVIKDIGRGAAGARSLTREQAHDTMARVLAGQVSDLQLGALLIALRMKGESLDEICGFLDATHAQCTTIHSDSPVVLIPSYNGARRLANLTPLLAMALAQEGVRVLVHGPLSDPSRVTTASVFHDLGLPVITDAQTAQAASHLAWARHQPAFITTAALCSPLHDLLARRWQLGVRNAGHTVAKLLNPVQGAAAFCIVNYTHPEFGALMQAWAQRERISAMLLRGTEGEPVADPRRLPRLDTFVHGQPCAAASCAAQDGVLAELPLLPRSNDAASTALHVQAVIAGERPAPGPLQRQVQAVLAGLAALQLGPVEWEKSA